MYRGRLENDVNVKRKNIAAMASCHSRPIAGKQRDKIARSVIESNLHA